MTTQETDRTQALADRIFGATIESLELMSVYLGDKLGLYQSLHDKGPASASELAERTGSDRRYLREWLEQQAVAGFLEVEREAEDPDERSFLLPEAHIGVLVGPEHAAYVAPFSRMLAGIGQALPLVVDAYGTGRGVDWSAYGEDARMGQSAINRPAFTTDLVTDWLPSIRDVHRRLQADPPARIADIGCGEGWSSIAMAGAYPSARVDGFDLDEASIEAARRHADAASMDHRLRFEARDAAGAEFTGSYDLVCIFEALHDMSHPVEALETARGMLAPGGSVLVADERVADAFAAPGDEVERMMYGWSILCCLLTGRTEPGSAATGTVMRTDTLRRYARAAGLSDVEVLPIENDLFRFYLLKP
ncbi:MAG: class I SAM-dependent methyltransferase [Actinomycetota bacterium]